ncbi:MAG TPA: TolC family protein, partial [Novosphingobium sp.]|nr:TolC family protein [Novosphingobium sp.]
MTSRSAPVAMLALLLAGCAAGPDFAPPQMAGPAGYAPADAPNAAPGQTPAREWWKAFGSEELDELVARALAGNASLAASRATLQRAQERANAIAGRRLPQVDASAKVQHQQVNLSAIGIADRFAAAGAPAFANPEFDLYSLGAGVSYDLDL